MACGALEKEVLGKALNYAFRFEILFDREVGESDPTASTYVLARPGGRNVIGVRHRSVGVFALLVTLSMADIIIIVLVINQIVVAISLVSFAARDEPGEYFQRVSEAAAVIDIYTLFTCEVDDARFCKLAESQRRLCICQPLREYGCLLPKHLVDSGQHALVCFIQSQREGEQCFFHVFRLGRFELFEFL